MTAAGQRAGAALGSCWWSRPGRLRGHCRWSAKCSVMMGGQLVSSRRLIGRSGPKSGSAGSSWRPQLTQISAAPQTLAPVLQDKPRHSTDLVELCSPILLSLHWPTASLFTRIRNIFCHLIVAPARRQKENALRRRGAGQRPPTMASWHGRQSAASVRRARGTARARAWPRRRPRRATRTTTARVLASSPTARARGRQQARTMRGRGRWERERL